MEKPEIKAVLKKTSELLDTARADMALIENEIRGRYPGFEPSNDSPIDGVDEEPGVLYYCRWTNWHPGHESHLLIAILEDGSIQDYPTLTSLLTAAFNRTKTLPGGAK